MRLRSSDSSALLPLSAALLTVAAGAGGASHEGDQASASAWRGLVGTPRQQVAVGQRVIVVLNSPSLADRVAAAGGTATESQERQWTAAALAADNLLITRLAQAGVQVRPEHRFGRVLTGFSAPLDPSAVTLLEHAPEVAGVYPVRIAYPASASSTQIEEGRLAAGSGSRANVLLPGSDGSGVTIALLDTGVEANHPYLLGQVAEGYDVVDSDRDPGASASPEDPTRLERHGTQLAGLMVGSEGPAGLNGIAGGATVLPIRVAGWQPEAGGRWAVYGRTDQLVAGLERAVDPNGDGARSTQRESRSSGSRSRSRPSRTAPLPVPSPAPFGSTRWSSRRPATTAWPAPGTAASPGLVAHAPRSRWARRTFESPPCPSMPSSDPGFGVFFDQRVPLVGAVAPRGSLALGLAAPRLDRSAILGGTPPKLSDFFDARGFSYVAGRAALVPAGADPGYAAAQAVKAGATLVVVYGDELPGGGIGLDEGVTVPVVTVPGSAGRAALESIRSGRQPLVSVGLARGEVSQVEGHVTPFSSRGLAFDGFVKPDLVAPGVSLLTADPGQAEDGTARYASLSGSSASAAVVAGAAALLAQSRPELDASALKGLLVGSARPLTGETVVAQGAGLLDIGAARAGEAAALPTTMSFGRATGADWHATRKLILRNLSSRRLLIRVSGDERDQGGGRGLVFALRPGSRSHPSGWDRQVVCRRPLAHPRRAAGRGHVSACVPREAKRSMCPGSSRSGPEKTTARLRPALDRQVPAL